MSIDTNTLVLILDEAVTSGMEAAISKHGGALSEEQKRDLRNLNAEQIKDALSNLLQANQALGKLLWFDNNNNNN